MNTFMRYQTPKFPLLMRSLFSRGCRYRATPRKFDSGTTGDLPHNAFIDSFNRCVNQGVGKPLGGRKSASLSFPPKGFLKKKHRVDRSSVTGRHNTYVQNDSSICGSKKISFQTFFLLFGFLSVGLALWPESLHALSGKIIDVEFSELEKMAISGVRIILLVFGGITAIRSMKESNIGSMVTGVLCIVAAVFLKDFITKSFALVC